MSKADKYIAVLNKQIDKLDDDGFDLEAWKSSAQSRLSSIFGDKDPRIKQINDLKLDYGSWALRDSNSKYKPVETCKKKVKEIIESLIDEIEIVGLPEDHEEEDLVERLEKAVSDDVGEKIKTYLSSKDANGLKNYLNSLNKKALSALLTELLIP